MVTYWDHELISVLSKHIRRKLYKAYNPIQWNTAVGKWCWISYRCNYWLLLFQKYVIMHLYCNAWCATQCDSWHSWHSVTTGIQSEFSKELLYKSEWSGYFTKSCTTACAIKKKKRIAHISCQLCFSSHLSSFLVYLFAHSHISVSFPSVVSALLNSQSYHHWKMGRVFILHAPEIQHLALKCSTDFYIQF